MQHRGMTPRNTRTHLDDRMGVHRLWIDFTHTLTVTLRLPVPGGWLYLVQLGFSHRDKPLLRAGDPAMTEIPFTQFLRPTGDTRQTFIDVPHQVALLATRFIEEGGGYTSELLRTGEVSLCAEFTVNNERQDVACIYTRNGPGIEEAVEKLVRPWIIFGL